MSVARRGLGRRLRHLREHSGYTIKRLANELEWSEQRIWRLETGQVSVRPSDVHLLALTFGADADMTNALKELARQTKSQDWWHAYSDSLPEWADLYVGLEGVASSLDIYESELIPGLLQTPAYARKVISTYHPTLDAETIDRRVKVRTERQSVLHRTPNPLVVRAVVNESVLHRPVGGRSHWVEQLRNLLEMMRLPNLALGVVPVSKGLHMGMITGSFSVLRFPEESDPDTVYTEGYQGAVYLEEAHTADKYLGAFEQLWEQAVGDSDSQRLIENAVKEHGK